jgi:hypothetical protein
VSGPAPAPASTPAAASWVGVGVAAYILLIWFVANVRPFPF